MLLLLLLLLCLQTSLQQQTPPGRCDIMQRVVVHTSCTSCAAVTTSSCPHGFSSIGTNNCSYVVQIGGTEMELSGCQHICVKSFLQPQCCPQHWGSICHPCPSWSGKTCNFHGTCLDGDVGNGTCVCDDGFSGFACQECKNQNAFGENCDKVCDCVHGVCNKGPEGDGKCFCQPPYTGKRCDQVSTTCIKCSPYSYCKGDGDAAACECLPGYRKSPQNKCSSICLRGDCDVNAQCSLKGLKVTCACKPDYQGDGRICVPKNPCSVNNGGCPINSTVCVFKGPNKSSCECMSGMSPVGGNPEFGCQLVSACSADTCDSTAVCETGLDGHPRCVCEASQIGDGRRCYGNLMEQLIELDRSGSQRENLTGAIALFEKGCSLLLSHNGPFTAFIPLLKTPLTGINEMQVCTNHLILGQHLYKDLVGRDFILYGGARLRSKDNKMTVKQSAGGGGGERGGEGGGGSAVCLVCKESCSGFQPHSWRKACTACGCSTVDHAPGSDVEDDQQMGRLLADSPCSHLTAKVKGGGGLRMYKRNRMIVTNPVVSRKDPTFNTTTYDWAPAGLNQKLAMQYMELIPESQRTVSGTEGALERRRQLLSQLPAYDQDPMKCQSLASEEEISSMLLFVKHYKQEVLGVGEVALPGEGDALKEAANQRTAKEAKDRSNSDKKDSLEHQDHGSAGSNAAGSTNGTDEGTKTEHRCTGCHGEVAKESPAVYAERAGYRGALWHPTCFVCSECGQGLVDLVYFWSNQKLFCGRHYCQTVWPRCSGCDELIFCQSFHTANDGRTWHRHHYCCWKCGQSLDTPCQH